VLHCLRDHLIIDEVAHLGDQLPMLVRGIYYQAWRPSGKPEKSRSQEDLEIMELFAIGPATVARACECSVAAPRSRR
jgi:uncharacterized protein (DUF2267 family)